MRGAACTWNDNIDRDLDRQVARCRLRPIARGAVSPLQGHVFTVAQSVVGLALLAQLPTQCAYYAVPVVIMLGLYPFAKRFTNYPQVILGFPVAWGMFLASTAVGVDPFARFFSADSPVPVDSLVLSSMICFYMSNIAWTVIYDTIYAFQDVKDDAKAEIKSIAVRHKANPKILLSSLAVTQVSLLAATGFLAGMSPLYFLGSCGGTAVSLAIMISKVNLARPESCAWWFRMGTWFVGLTVAGGLGAEYSMKLRKASADTSI
ncbi:Para-hydroxybenzoate--polyprenyltransferase, mitochondrial precursor (PHB:polyprenyltransferase) [Xylographa parallela]|nr:Para-hydroxybenzoate--polyprenyltransferase, mitochondrial precursor (PHB:polyprenyltransferase) [Xylographa parallela]